MSDPIKAPAPGVYNARPHVKGEAVDSTYLASDPLDRDPRLAINDPTIVSAQLWQAYVADPTISRNINQVVEQGTGDGEARPTIDNEAVNEALTVWWKQEKMDLRIRPAFKAFLISGEIWHYVPLRPDRIPLRELTPWSVSEIEGYSFTDWLRATYRNQKAPESNLALTPDNTNFFAHDALFDNLRGLTPFATMLFSAKRYRRFLDARERVNRLAGIVTGELNFANLQDAAAVLGWPIDDSTGQPIPQTVTLPEEGTITVTIGESRFDLKTPNVNGAGSDPDAQRFYLRVIEGGRLPEYASGNGANVNVATASVQYPFAVRFMLSLRDEFEYAMSATLRMILTRMVRLGFIPERWTATRGDGTTEIETPDTATISWSFPEIRELDFEAHFNSILQLVSKNLLLDEKAMELLGYDPETDMPTPEERAARRADPLGLGGGNPFGGQNDEEEEARVLAYAVRTVLMQLLSNPGDAPED